MKNKIKIRTQVTIALLIFTAILYSCKTNYYRSNNKEPNNLTGKYDTTFFNKDWNKYKQNKNGAYELVEIMPQFTGGEKARIKYLIENINYPIYARRTGIQGKVYVTFIVEKDGSITNINILRGIGGGCDEEVIRIVENMPKWSPGIMDGKPVRWGVINL